MGPAPQPPHERAWRHPSELTPTAAEVRFEDERSGGRALVLATGVAAAMMAAVMVVALTPPPSNAPTAISATTLPAMTTELRGAAVQDLDTAPSARGVDLAPVDGDLVSRANALTLVDAPNAVSTAPSDLDALNVASRIPDDDERIYVLTRSDAFALRWSEIGLLVVPDGSAVVTADGEIVATFLDGELFVLVD